MGEFNYLVVEIYPMGAQRVIGQFGNIDDALLLLGQLISRYSDSSNMFGICTVMVNDSESVHRYDDISARLSNKEEKEND